MRRKLLASLLGAVLACATEESAAQEPPVDIYDREEVLQHLQSPYPAVRMPWRESPNLFDQARGLVGRAHAVVDETGAVSEVRVTWTWPEEGKAEAEAAVRAMHFAPFERGGRRVRARFELDIESLREDYSGPPDRAFPESYDLAHVRVRLARTGCYGSCPAYEVAIGGDGSVVYRGRDMALIQGEHRWRIPQADVASLVEQFRRADYFNLGGYYRFDSSDLPVNLTGLEDPWWPFYITALEIGPRKKFVFGDGRPVTGDFAPVPIVLADGGEPAPPSVRGIEDTIDRLAAVDAWVYGNESTVGALKAQGWDFRSRDSGRAVAFLAVFCKVPVARAFIAEGAPVAVPEDRIAGEPTALETAPRCGDLGFVRELIRKGAIRRRGAPATFLRASVRSGFPDIVAEALRYWRDVNRRSRHYRRTLLMEAVEAHRPQDGDPRAGKFNIASVVSLLLAAGANARAVDDDDNTALHLVDDAEASRALIRAGANPNAQNWYLHTPLFSKSNAGAVRALIEAGADPNARGPRASTPLFTASSAEAVRALVAAGADIDARNVDGETALEALTSEEAALALIDLGAEIPGDETRLRRLIESARLRQWNRLWPVLLQRAESR